MANILDILGRIHDSDQAQEFSDAENWRIDCSPSGDYKLSRVTFGLRDLVRLWFRFEYKDSQGGSRTAIEASQNAWNGRKDRIRVNDDGVDEAKVAMGIDPDHVTFYVKAGYTEGGQQHDRLFSFPLTALGGDVAQQIVDMVT